MNLRNFLFICATLAFGCTTTTEEPPAAVPIGSAFSLRAGGSLYDGGKGVAVSADGRVAVLAAFWDTVDFGAGPLVSAGNADAVLATWDAEGNPGMSLRFGTAEHELARHVVAAGAGAWVFGIHTEKELDLGGGPLVPQGVAGTAITKLDAEGGHVFSMMFPGWLEGLAAAGDDAIVAAGTFSGTVVVGGETFTGAGGEDILVTKLDEKGAPVWTRAFGSVSQEHMEVAVDPSGNVLLGGALRGPIDFGGGLATNAGEWDAALVKLDADGKHVFTKTFGDASFQLIKSVATDAEGNIFVGGLFEGGIDFGNGEIRAEGRDLFLAKFDPTGAPRWARSFALIDADWDDATPRIATDPAGGLVVTGDFVDAIDLGGGQILREANAIFFARYDAAGNHVESRGVARFLAP